MSSGLRPTPVCLLTGAWWLVHSAPPEPRPKCDRVHFKQKIRSTPCRVWNPATFGRSTNLAGNRWICDVGIMPTSHIQRSSAEIVDRPNVAEVQIRQGVERIFCLKCTLSHFGRGSGGALRTLVIRNLPAPVNKLTGVVRSPVDIGAGAFGVSVGN